VKRENALSIAMVLFGVITGIAVVVLLMAIAAPSTSQYLLTHAEKADYDRIDGYSRILSGAGSWIAYGLFFAALGLAVSFFLTLLNPSFNIKKASSDRKMAAGTRALVFLAAAAGWIYGTAFLLDLLFPGGPSRAIQFLFYVVLFAGVWFIIGRQGWAGDLSSWKVQKNARLMRTALLGAAVGAVVFLIYWLFDWSFRQYFTLVSEVLDQSGETSFLGFVQLAFGAVICLGVAFPLAAGFVAALAPVEQENREILRRLMIPGAAFLVIAVLLAAAYWYAGAVYDLNKKDLATAVGIPARAKESRTIVALVASKGLPVTVQEWPLEASSSGFMSQNTIELSVENLQKVESYLAAHPQGTVFTYPGREILVKGYYGLWDRENGLAWQVRAAESQLLQRQLLLTRFRSMAVTQENLKLLESYSDEKVWRVGGKSALYLSQGYQHFGKAAEAAKWLEKAIALGTDISKADFVKDPIITYGSLQGRILLNGKPLSGVKVGLLSHRADMMGKESFKLTDFSFPRMLVDVRQAGKDGRFAFSSLGTGRYLIAVMTDKETMPYDLKPGTITASNVPGIISLGAVASRDLGTIAIVKKQ